MPTPARSLASSCLLLMVLAPAGTALAGGFLETADVTGHRPSPLRGRVIADLVPTRWDARCMPVPFRLAASTDPVPNPLGPPVLNLSQVAATVEQAFQQWRSIPTSYFDPRLVGTVASPGGPRYDFVNEIAFGALEDPSLIAQIFPTTLMEDRLLTPGQDLDGDGDADVSGATSTCADVDSDGDFELPAGSYPAGTLLDADIVLNSARYRFTVGDGAVDNNGNSVDLLAVVLHEVGHSLGLCHVLENQLSDTDGTGAVMFPFIDVEDPASELAARHLSDDDVAWASFAYPEGTASSGPAALQPGDQRFSARYGLLAGEVRQGEEGLPVAGGSVAVVSGNADQVVGAGFSGHARVALDLDRGTDDPISVEWGVLDGEWQIPVSPGLYRLRLEAPDGLPVAAPRINETVEVGGRLGQLVFPEESYGADQESTVEERPGLAVPVRARAGQTVATESFLTNEVRYLGTLRGLDDVSGFSATPGTYHALRIPNADLRAAAEEAALVITGGDFLTYTFEDSVVPFYAEALLVWGITSTDGKTATLDLANPLRSTQNFVGQHTDFTPFYFDRPRVLGAQVENGVYADAQRDLFLVLRVPLTTPFPGASGAPPVVGVSLDKPYLLRSYRSANGVSFARREDEDTLFRLVLTP